MTETKKAFGSMAKQEQNIKGFVAVSRTMAGVGHLKRICTGGLRAAGAVQETSSSKMLGGQGAFSLRRVAFGDIKSSGLLR